MPNARFGRVQLKPAQASGRWFRVRLSGGSGRQFRCAGHGLTQQPSPARLGLHNGIVPARRLNSPDDFGVRRHS